jgi:hypothetical protein
MPAAPEVVLGDKLVILDSSFFRIFEVLPDSGKIWKFAVNVRLDLMSRFIYSMSGCLLWVREFLAIENWLFQRFSATPLSCLYGGCTEFQKT